MTWIVQSTPPRVTGELKQFCGEDWARIPPRGFAGLPKQSLGSKLLLLKELLPRFCTVCLTLVWSDRVYL